MHANMQNHMQKAVKCTSTQGARPRDHRAHEIEPAARERLHPPSYGIRCADPAAANARRALLNVLCLIMRQKKAAEPQRRPMHMMRSAGGVAGSSGACGGNL